MNKLDVTLPVVCDACNNTWMSDVSNLAKAKLEPLIRRDTPADFDEFDILVVASFAFLKSAVLDWSADTRHRRPCIPKASCLRFRASLTAGPFDDIALTAFKSGSPATGESPKWRRWRSPKN